MNKRKNEISVSACRAWARPVCFALALGITCLGQNAKADDGTWINPASSDFETTTNWLNGIVPFGTDSIANFNALDLPAAGNITVTLNNSRPVGALNFGDTDPSTVGSWTLAATSGNFISLSSSTAATITVGPSTALPNNGLTSATISAQIGGASSPIVKDGSGTLTLTSTASAFTGGLTVKGGTLNIGVTFNSAANTGPAGATSSPIILNGGNLSLGAFTIANPIQVVSDATITNTTTGGVFEFRGAITGSATATFAIQTGATVTLGNGSTTTPAALANFTGTLSFGTSTGTLRFNGASSGVYVAGSTMAVFDMGTGTGSIRERNGGTINMGALTGTGTGTALTGASNNNGSVGVTTEYHVGFLNTNTTFNGKLTDNTAARNVALFKEGTGSLTLTNATSTYTGATTVVAGTLIAQGDTTLGGSRAITINAGGALTLAGGTTNNYINDFAAVTLNVDANAVLANGKINLNFVGADTVAMLTLGGNAFTSGTFNATTNPDFFTGTGSLLVVAVPEPSTWLMMIGGLGALAFSRRRRGGRGQA